jgi:hypothetical protein
MSRSLQIAIEPGETTCARAPGEFCRFVGTVGMGQRWVCRLFPATDGAHTNLEERSGWLQRLPECMAAEVDATA